jgi:chromosome segregation ATPase
LKQLIPTPENGLQFSADLRDKYDELKTLLDDAKTVTSTQAAKVNEAGLKIQPVIDGLEKRLRAEQAASNKELEAKLEGPLAELRDLTKQYKLEGDASQKQALKDMFQETLKSLIEQQKTVRSDVVNDEKFIQLQAELAAKKLELVNVRNSEASVRASIVQQMKDIKAEYEGLNRKLFDTATNTFQELVDRVTSDSKAKLIELNDQQSKLAMEKAEVEKLKATNDTIKNAQLTRIEETLAEIKQAKTKQQNIIADTSVPLDTLSSIQGAIAALTTTYDSRNSDLISLLTDMRNKELEAVKAERAALDATLLEVNKVIQSKAITDEERVQLLSEKAQILRDREALQKDLEVAKNTFNKLNADLRDQLEGSAQQIKNTIDNATAFTTSELNALKQQYNLLTEAKGSIQKEHVDAYTKAYTLLTQMNNQTLNNDKNIQGLAGLEAAFKSNVIQLTTEIKLLNESNKILQEEYKSLKDISSEKEQVAALTKELEQARALLINERAKVATTNSGDLTTSLQKALDSLSGVKGVSDGLIASLQSKITQINTSIKANSTNLAAMSTLEKTFTENLRMLQGEITSLQDGQVKLQAQFEASKNSNNSEAIQAIQAEYGKITALLNELELTKATIESKANQVLAENNTDLKKSLRDAINQLAGSKGVNEQLIAALQSANVAGLQAQITDISDISAALARNKQAVLDAIANPSQVTIPNLNNIMQVLEISNNNLKNLPTGYLEALKTLNDTINTSIDARLQAGSNTLNNAFAALQAQYNDAATILQKHQTSLVQELTGIKTEYEKLKSEKGQTIRDIAAQQAALKEQYNKLNGTLSQIQQAQTGATDIQQNIARLNEAINTISGQPLFDRLEALRTSVADLPAKYDAITKEISKNTEKFDNAAIGRAIKFTDRELNAAISNALPSKENITVAVTAAYKGTVNVNVTQDDIKQAIGDKLKLTVPTSDITDAISNAVDNRLPTAVAIIAAIKEAVKEQGVRVDIDPKALLAGIKDKIVVSSSEPVDANKIAAIAAKEAIAEFKKEVPDLITNAVNQAVAQVIHQVVKPLEVDEVLIKPGQSDADVSGVAPTLPDMAQKLKEYFEDKEVKVKQEFQAEVPLTASQITESLAGCKPEFNQQGIIDGIVASLKAAEPSLESPELVRVKAELEEYKANYDILQGIIVGSKNWAMENVIDSGRASKRKILA